MNVRHWQANDIPAVFPLMRDLAVFEEYIDAFNVTETALFEQGFKRQPPNLYCLVAELETEIVGVLVYYFLPFTASAKPALYIKELFVTEAARGHGAGKALMTRAALEAKRAGCNGVKWTVADWNQAAQRFYEGLGATPNPVWIEYSLDRAALERLAEGA